MIIRSLRAENFMKYESLELADLPRGAIAIVGENEAGKTTIGEAVAFALFGRTIRTEETDPAQAIHWDSDRATTTIEFELFENGNHATVHRQPGVYRLERAIERGGGVEARLYAPSGQLLGTNPREVARALPRVLGFSFPEFRYSFYVAQKELDLVRHATRDNTRRIIYDMLGITAVERARGLVQRELDEFKERSRTVDRDLVVARALLNEAEGDREAGDAAVRDLESAEAEAGAAATAEEAARNARERAVNGADARRDGLTAFSRLEGAVLANAQRAKLAQARATLAGALAAAKPHLDKAQATLQKDERARAEARAALERARGAREAARSLAALVDARAARLRTEVAQAEGQASPEGGLSLGERTARESERARKSASAKKWRTIKLALLVLIFLVAGAGAAGLRVPPDKPLLKELYKPLEFSLEGHTVVIGEYKAFWALAILSAVSFVWSIFAFLGRQAASVEAFRSSADLASLSSSVEKLKADLAACEGFEPNKLRDIEVTARRIEGDEAIAKAASAFHEAAKDLAESDLSPDALVEECQKKIDALEKDRATAEPRYRDATRIQQSAQRGLEAADSVLDEKARVTPPSDIAGLDLPALEKRVEEAAAQAARSKIELEALHSAGQDGTLAEGARELIGALQKVFEARPEAKATFDSQSGLRALMDSAKSGASSMDDLREALRRERAVLKNVLGGEDDARSALSAAEESYRKARDARARAEARLAEARARGERAHVGRARAQELEAKVAGLEEILAPLSHDTAVHEECLRLQDDLIGAMKARFGPGITRYIEVVLPRLTGGRYRKTRLDPDLDLRVFSNERGDFVRLVDISFGTADQVLLALRLGLARALVASRGISGAHFLFLDEPLASADETRGQAFLELIRGFDDEFAQVFVTSARPLEGEFSKRIQIQTATKLVKA